MAARNFGMRRALVVQGSPTTTGGVVIGGSAAHMTDHGKPFALHGDEATCGKCKGTFKILGTAIRRCYRGQAGVIEGNLVLCPCRQNRVMASPDPGCFYEDGDCAGTGVEVASTTLLSDGSKHVSWVRVQDSETGEPLRNREFVIHIDGVKQSGRTDGDGFTKIETDGGHSFAIHATFASPKRALKPEQGS